MSRGRSGPQLRARTVTRTADFRKSERGLGGPGRCNSPQKSLPAERLKETARVSRLPHAPRALLDSIFQNNCVERNTRCSGSPPKRNDSPGCSVVIRAISSWEGRANTPFTFYAHRVQRSVHAAARLFFFWLRAGPHRLHCKLFALEEKQHPICSRRLAAAARLGHQTVRDSGTKRCSQRGEQRLGDVDFFEQKNHLMGFRAGSCNAAARLTSSMPEGQRSSASLPAQHWDQNAARAASLLSSVVRTESERG